MLKNAITTKVLLMSLVERGGMMLKDGGAVIWKEGAKKGLAERISDGVVDKLVAPIQEAVVTFLLTLLAGLGDIVFITGGIILAIGFLCVMFQYFKPLKVGAIVTLVGLAIKAVALV